MESAKDLIRQSCAWLIEPCLLREDDYWISHVHGVDDGVGYGVLGESDGWVGVKGQSNSGYGVNGESNSLWCSWQEPERHWCAWREQ